MTGSREVKGWEKRDGRRFHHTWENWQGSEINFSFCPFYIFLSLNALPLSSSCILSPTPAAPASVLSLSLVLFWLILHFAAASRSLSPVQFVVQLFFVRGGYKNTHTQEKRQLFPIVTPTPGQPAHAAQPRKPTADFPPTVYLSFEKLLSSLPSTQAPGVHTLVWMREGRGVKRGLLQDVG